jgi:hypothetical protein
MMRVYVGDLYKSLTLSYQQNMQITVNLFIKATSSALAPVRKQTHRCDLIPIALT